MRSIRAIVLSAMLAAAAGSAAAADADKVLVLGVDGLDPKLLQQFMDEGVLPNFKKLVAQGDFKPLQTTMPPLSPIAWSTFITGMDAGGHGIFDFIHRKPETLTPYLSMAEPNAVNAWPLRLPSSSRQCHSVLPLTWSAFIPFLTEEPMKNLRQGTAFWQILEKQSVPTTVFRMPANFPPAESPGKAFSGMGTPDATGTSGTFSYYTDRPPANARDIGGGKIYTVRVQENTVETQIWGPENPMRRCIKSARNLRSGGDREIEYEYPDLQADLKVYLDPENPVAMLSVQDDEQIVLKEGEWSDWVRIDFPALELPLPDLLAEDDPDIQSINATARFYLKQVRPDFQLYMSPLQINPEEPIMPISTPSSWSKKLWEKLGYFYTQELPEDTKAFQEGIFTGREFWTQAQHVYKERRRALDYFLDEFDEGFLFFYFSSVDQQSHMLWSYADAAHPGHQSDDMLIDGIKKVYVELDEVVGRTVESIGDDTTLIVMSDHGFCPFYWGVNLNTWLKEKGYATLRDPTKPGEYLSNVDWSKTKAYALGLNGLYINLEGREKRGIVPQAEYQQLVDQLEKDLLEMVDPRNGENAVTLVVQPRRDFHGEFADDGPDIIVGYNWAYRSSWESPLGAFPKEVFVDNDKAWSGDHSVDYRHVPGVLISNKKITMEAPALYDLTVAILDEYGIDKPEDMIGQDCLGERVAPATAEGAGPDQAAVDAQK